jgi:hypothetical protein
MWFTLHADKITAKVKMIGRVHTLLCVTRTTDGIWYYFYGSTALFWALAAFFSFLILYIVGRTRWTGTQPVARSVPKHRINTQNTDIHALSGLRTPDPSVEASEDNSCLTPPGRPL